MKVLVIGQGGREHAIVRALSLSPSAPEIHVIPGSDGMARSAVCHKLPLDDPSALQDFAKRQEIGLVIIGPENPLADGLADVFRNSDIPVFGPNGRAAQLEASKVFAKQFMVDAGIPTARAQIVSDVPGTLKAAQEYEPPYVLKADGLAGGKGVTISKTLEDLEAVATDLFEKGKFGAAGKMALLEEFQPGWELSYHVITNGKDFVSLPLAQDHKRLLEGDEGLNTGGMGTVAPMPIETELKEQIDEEIVKPWLEAVQKDSGMVYRGVLFIGLMVTEAGPKVIEFNVRFGDPETQVILPLLEGDWTKSFLAVAKGEVPELKWKNLSSACVVMAAGGYPESAKKDVSMIGDVFLETTNSYFLHAGTRYDEKHNWVTNGGRVLNAVAFGGGMRDAIENAYRQVDAVTWNGRQVRKDIGAKALKAFE